MSSDSKSNGSSDNKSDDDNVIPSRREYGLLYHYILWSDEIPAPFRNKLDKYFLLHWSTNQFFGSCRHKCRIIVHDGISYAVLYTHSTKAVIANIPDRDSPILLMSFRRVKGMPTGFVLPCVFRSTIDSKIE